MSDEFNPAQHIRQIRGKGGNADYLDVRWRIVWLRKDAPDSQIRTEHIAIDEQSAIFKATVTRIIDGEIRGVADGYGSETRGDFGDYIEKAETKAVGRALAALGYGTAAIAEDGDRIADAPVERSAGPDPRKPLWEEVRRLREGLGWSTDHVTKAAREQRWDMNTVEGIAAMVEFLKRMLAERADPVEAEVRGLPLATPPAKANGEAGFDTWTA